METEETEAAPEVVDTAAPVEPAEAPEVEAAPAPEPAAPEPAPEPAAPEVTPDAFGWDDWGGGVEDLPEAQRAWAERLMAWSDARLASDRAELERTRELYAALLDGAEDPRIAAGAAQLTELQTAFEAAKAEHTQAVQALQAQHEADIGVYKAYIEGQLKREADAFREEHAWIFDDKATSEQALADYDAGWPKDSLPVLLKLNKGAQKAARDAFGDRSGADEGSRLEAARLILRAVLAESGARPKARPAASVIGGADTTPSPSPRVQPRGEVVDITDPLAVQAAVRRNMDRAARSGRR